MSLWRLEAEGDGALRCFLLGVPLGEQLTAQSGEHQGSRAEEPRPVCLPQLQVGPAAPSGFQMVP